MNSSALLLIVLFVNSASAFLFVPSQQQLVYATHRRLPAVVTGLNSYCSLQSSGSDDEVTPADEPDESLLRMNLSINAGVDPDAALGSLRDFAKGFPFAAVLPVQPLTYMPSPTGVKVTFLRKKTEEKGSQDGGMDFSIEFTDVAPPDDDDDIEIGTFGTGRRINLSVSRISEGQTVSKMFSEKMVITEFVKRISAATENPDALGNMVSMDSFFHQWMD
eukprot:CAMPEP_0197715428 /NCGR_PEP_ID=MMETSP1434-20131217/590_1 /TAXON_ID=265543 /ORGANISM="Minutocellus polymorphus, Strain CCMP3303" /LENGTH=218 /DNA_ID=CAMNT_0043299525 /DNA_START=65 /DNA_END=721 /DNA_ORIENTATION=-